MKQYRVEGSADIIVKFNPCVTIDVESEILGIDEDVTDNDDDFAKEKGFTIDFDQTVEAKDEEEAREIATDAAEEVDVTITIDGNFVDGFDWHIVEVRITNVEEE